MLYVGRKRLDFQAIFDRIQSTEKIVQQIFYYYYYYYYLPNYYLLTQEHGESGGDSDSITIMPIVISPLVETDIPSAIECIQLAFADDPYAKWVYNRSKVLNLLLI